VKHAPILMLASAGLLAACSGRRPNAPAAAPQRDEAADAAVVIPADSPKLTQIRIAAVRSEEVPDDEIVAPGRIEANPNRLSRVLLPVPGRISNVLVRLGDRVSAGQSLLAVESPEADAAMSAYLQAEAALGQSKAALLKAQADLERAKDLYAHDAVAKKEVLNAENAFAQANAATEQAQAAQRQGLRRLELLGLKPGDFGQRVVVRAPSSGTILEMSVADGEYRNDTAAPVITIAGLSTVWISADVPESYIRFAQIGGRVDVTLAAYPGETFRARVARIADTVDPQTRTVKVRAEMENRQGRFRPEMFGSVRSASGTRVLPVVPASAVVSAEGLPTVFVEKQRGCFQPTPVTLGKRAGEVFPVVSGVSLGDRVVVDGTMLLKGP